MKIGMSQADVARRNRGAVLSMVRRSRKGMSRVALSEALGLTTPSLTKIARVLLASGIVREEPESARAGLGRPSTYLQLNPDWGCVVTVNLTHSLAFGVVNLSGELLDYECTDATPLRKYHYRDDFDARVCAGVKRALEKLSGRRVLGIGVISSGRVDRDGIICRNDELPREDVDMRKVLAPVTDLPVWTDEEFRLLLLGHLWRQPAPSWRHAVVMGSYYSGFGGGQAAVVNGEVYYGRRGFAGLPAIFMATLHGEAEAMAWNRQVTAMGGEAGYMRRVQEGDPNALDIFAKSAENYGYRVAQVANHFNPDVVLIYANYQAVAEEFVRRVRQTAERHADPLNLQGMEIRLCGPRSNEERLRAAALPALATVYRDGRLDAAVYVPATRRATRQAQVLAPGGSPARAW